jgi:hypothetical protein
MAAASGYGVTETGSIFNWGTSGEHDRTNLSGCYPS